MSETDGVFYITTFIILALAVAGLYFAPAQK